jgi:transcriptional regulator with XRE-family HTH domain
MSHTDLPTSREIREERLQTDPEFRAYWERTALARAVANQLIAYRIEHKLTQAELAEKLGMRQPHVARLETGEHTPGWETLYRIACNLGIAVVLTIGPAQKQSIWHSIEGTISANDANVERITSPATGTRTVIATRALAQDERQVG